MNGIRLWDVHDQFAQDQVRVDGHESIPGKGVVAPSTYSRHWTGIPRIASLTRKRRLSALMIS
jgi:hypothetical protein